jgi:hypothetical protein
MRAGKAGEPSGVTRRPAGPAGIHRRRDAGAGPTTATASGSVTATR